MLTIYIDGGSRGNPGPSASAAVLSDEQAGIAKSCSQFLGVATNNTAEYQALILAFKKAKALLGKVKAKKTNIEIRSDSQLLVSQLNGQYKILHPDIQQLFLEAWNLKIDFAKVNFVLISREENTTADKLVNEALDIQSKKQTLF